MNCGLQYESVLLLFVGTLNVNNTDSLQEVKGDVQRIIANLMRQLLVWWSVFSSIFSHGFSSELITLFT